jgi:hypothetical protein
VPAPPVNQEYAKLVARLYELRQPGLAGCYLEFDEGAQKIRNDLAAVHLNLQVLEGVNRKLASHIGKYDGLFARLCIIWHCVDYVSQSLDAEEQFSPYELPQQVTERTAQRVADFLHGFLRAHALAFYSGILGLADDHDRLTSLAGFILAHRKEQVTSRDIARGDRSMRGLKEYETRAVLEQMAALGWLERTDGPRPSSPPRWLVNPKIHDRFADRAKRETERRERARAATMLLSGGGR